MFDTPELTALGKGELYLTIYPEDAPASRITTKIVSRISCDIFDCILQPAEPGTANTANTGIAYMYFTKDGGLKYNIK